MQVANIRLRLSLLLCMQGAALLWVHESKQADVHPLVVSHGYGLGFRGEFLWQGTSDPTAWLSVSACIQVMQALQPLEVAQYNHSLVRQAAQLLLKAWGTQIELGVGKDGSTAGMVAVQMPWPLRGTSNNNSSGRCSCASSNGCTSDAPPVAVNGVAIDRKDTVGVQPTSADAAALNMLLRQQYKIEVPVACIEGMLFCRISAQIYNNIQDYQRLADVVLELAQQI
eukprot:GHUV01028638.1.p1 GENE.GHUV01028638.1~~GHUV01028638.1.p1  ORF type:complete len:226 (-),score=48.47 GHUV01028638.1:400-1077(-)